MCRWKSLESFLGSLSSFDVILIIMQTKKGSFHLSQLFSSFVCSKPFAFSVGFGKSYRPSLKVHQNFRDRDCITLRPIRSYTSYQVFFITMGNNDVYAADACAWLDYFCRHSTTHPLTRMAIPLTSVWNAFFVAQCLLPQQSPLLLQCKSVKVKPERRLERTTKREVIKLGTGIAFT